MAAVGSINAPYSLIILRYETVVKGYFASIFPQRFKRRTLEVIFYMKLRANSIVKLKGASEIKPGALFDIADETIARRLVDVGYAIAVDGMLHDPQCQTVLVRTGGGKSSEAPKLVTPNASMSLAALKELALQYGVDASKKRSKNEVIALIMAAGKEPQ